MLDDPTTPVETPEVEPTEPSGEAVAETPDAPETESSAPPWGEDFNPERAWNTIQAQREENKQLKQSEADAKAYRALREDPEAFQAFLDEQGYEVADDGEPEAPDDDTDDEDEDEYLDPLEQRLMQLEQAEQARLEQQEQAREKAELDRLVTNVEQQFTQIGKEFDDDDKQFFVNDSRRFPPLEDGSPDIKASYEAELARFHKWQKGWADTKKGAVVPGAGTPGTQAPNFDNEQERHAWQQSQMAVRTRDD